MLPLILITVMDLFKIIIVPMEQPKNVIHKVPKLIVMYFNDY